MVLIDPRLWRGWAACGLALYCLTCAAADESGAPAAAGPQMEPPAASPPVVLPAAPEASPFGPGPGRLAAPRQRKQVGPPIDIERLDGYRARVGTIVVDRRERRFTLPGRVLRDQPPLEFLAVTQGAAKAYEAVLELDTDAYRFNIACLLIGLDSDWKQAPRGHFDPLPAQGKTATVTLRWEQDGQRREVPAHEIFEGSGSAQANKVWVYTGSKAVGQKFLAAQDGTLIGFSHDPASLIEHREGIGLGDYGSVRIKPGALPPVGNPVELEVRWISRSEAGIPIPEGEPGGGRDARAPRAAPGTP